jgi:hypothetical protein
MEMKSEEAVRQQSASPGPLPGPKDSAILAADSLLTLFHLFKSEAILAAASLPKLLCAVCTDGERCVGRSDVFPAAGRCHIAGEKPHTPGASPAYIPGISPWPGHDAGKLEREDAAL